MSRVTLPRTPARFLDWIQQTYAPQAAVCLRSNQYGCPLAMYLTAQGASFARVHGRTYTTTGPRSSMRRLPSWALAFVTAVDNNGPAHSILTAAEACTLLQGTRL